MKKLILLLCVLAFGLNANAQMRDASIDIQYRQNIDWKNIDIRKIKQKDVVVNTSPERLAEIREQMAKDMSSEIKLDRICIYEVYFDNGNECKVYFTYYNIFKDTREVSQRYLAWYTFYKDGRKPKANFAKVNSFVNAGMTVAMN